MTFPGLFTILTTRWVRVELVPLSFTVMILIRNDMLDTGRVYHESFGESEGDRAFMWLEYMLQRIYSANPFRISTHVQRISKAEFDEICLHTRMV